MGDLLTAHWGIGIFAASVQLICWIRSDHSNEVGPGLVGAIAWLLLWPVVGIAFAWFWYRESVEARPTQETEE